MRVVMHAPWPAEYVAELARALSARADITRLCLVVRSDFAYAEAVGCSVARCYPAARVTRGRWQRLAAHAKALVRTAACIWRERPDIFHVQALHQPLLDWPLLVIARLRGARLVWTAHNSLPHESARFDRALFRRIYRHVDAVIVHTRFTADTLVRQMGTRSDHIHVIAHGPLTLGAAEALPRTDARQALGVADDTFLLLLFGRLRPYKGLDLLLEALDRLADPAIHLIVAGEDALGDAAGQLADRRDVTADLRRVDAETTARYFAAADLVVLPYRRIDQSGVLMLALTYGCAVLASDIGGLGEVIDDERSGFLLKPVDAETLATRVAAIKARPDVVDRVRAHVAAEAHGERGWPQLAELTAGVYHGVA
ncbi:glycosyl transferase, group 1 [Salinisphaera sp. T5B8]|uniref:glycosyltransferase family 4 protein n=1 Tax=Salinisphaera sp. T5B8 TaxID=1304154 RepID=UPI00333ECE50